METMKERGEELELRKHGKTLHEEGFVKSLHEHDLL